MADIPAYPLYNTTYLLYRASPLHHGDTTLMNEQSLRTHARQLRNQLKGDNIRGVEVDFAGTEGAWPTVGPLEDCNWDIIGDEDDWINRQRHVVDPEASQVSANISAEHARGLHVTLEYERNSYSALLLRDPTNTTSPEGFTALPLLMLKMPAPIREVFLKYLRTTFDAHVAPLRLAPTFLTSTLETYFRHLNASTSTQSIRDVVRQLQLQLSFTNNSSLLKHIDVNISSNDVPAFVKRGTQLRHQTRTPFTSAISTYLQKHLALDLSHPKVQITKVTCGSFVLSLDRLKLFAPADSDVSIIEGRDSPGASASQLAAHELYVSMIREATGTGKFLPENLVIERDSATPSSDGGNARLQDGRGRRKRAISTTTPVGGNAKRSKARGKENRERADGGQNVGRT